MVETAVILAAGQGTRFAPLSAFIPKEMLPLGRKPALEWIVQEILSVGVKEIVLVSAPAKLAMECYFETLAGIYGFHPQIVCQTSPCGTADALLRAQRYLHGPFLIYYADEIWIGEPTRAQQLCAAHAELRSSVLSVVRQDDSDLLSRLGVVDTLAAVRSGLWCIKGIVEKPPIEKIPSDLALVSGMLLEQCVLEEIECAFRGRRGRRELYLTEAIARLCPRYSVYAVELKGEWIDAGTLEQYPRAFVRAALAEEGDEFRSFLASVVQP